MASPYQCDCGYVGEVADALAGGITNCAACGRAVAVEGLRDPWWRLLQAVGALAWAGATAVAYAAGGVAPAVVVALVVAGGLWLLSRAL